MAGRDIASTWRARAKIVLPAIVLAMLASIFLLASKPKSQNTFDQIDQALSDTAQAQNLTLTSVTDTGKAFEIKAEHAELQGDKVALRQIAATLNDQAKSITRLDARSGEASMSGDRVWLFGDVHIAFPSGLDVVTQALEIDTNQHIIRSPSTIRGRTDFGQIRAGSAEIDTQTSKFYFRDDVHLIYQE